MLCYRAASAGVHPAHPCCSIRLPVRLCMAEQLRPQLLPAAAHQPGPGGFCFPCQVGVLACRGWCIDLAWGHCQPMPVVHFHVLCAVACVCWMKFTDWHCSAVATHQCSFNPLRCLMVYCTRGCYRAFATFNMGTLFCLLYKISRSLHPCPRTSCAVYSTSAH